MLLIYIIFKPFKIYQKKKKPFKIFNAILSAMGKGLIPKNKKKLSEKNTKIPFVLPNFANAILDFMMTILITQKINKIK